MAPSDVGMQSGRMPSVLTTEMMKLRRAHHTPPPPSTAATTGCRQSPRMTR
jgi:hypothetical protein